MSKFNSLHKEIFRGPNVTPSSYTPSDLTLSKTNFNASQSHSTNQKLVNTSNSIKKNTKYMSIGHTLPVDLQMTESPFYIIQEEQEEIFKTINSSQSQPKSKNLVVEQLMEKVQKKVLSRIPPNQKQSNFRFPVIPVKTFSNNNNKSFSTCNNNNKHTKSKTCIDFKSASPKKIYKQKKTINITVDTDLLTPTLQTPIVSQIEGTTQIQKKVLDNIQKNSQIFKRFRNRTVHEFGDYQKSKKTQKFLQQPKTTPVNISTNKINQNNNKNNNQENINKNNTSNNYTNNQNTTNENKSQSIFSQEQSLDLKIHKTEVLQQQNQQNIDLSRQVGKIVKNKIKQKQQQQQNPSINQEEDDQKVLFKSKSFLSDLQEDDLTTNNENQEQNKLFNEYIKKSSLDSLQNKQQQQKNKSINSQEDSFYVTGSKNYDFQIENSPFSVCKNESEQEEENQNINQQKQNCNQKYDLQVKQDNNNIYDFSKKSQKIEDQQINATKIQQRVSSSPFLSKNQSNDFFLLRESPVKLKEKLKQTQIQNQNQNQNQVQVQNPKLKTIKRQKSSLTLLRNQINYQKTRVQSQESKKNQSQSYQVETKKRNEKSLDFIQDFKESLLQNGVQLNFNSSEKQNQTKENENNNNNQKLNDDESKRKKSVFNNLFLETQSIIQNINIGSSQSQNNNYFKINNNNQNSKKEDQTTQKKVKKQNTYDFFKQLDGKSRKTTSSVYNNQSYIMNKISNNQNHLKHLNFPQRKKGLPVNTFYYIQNFEKKQQINQNGKNRAQRGVSVDFNNNKNLIINNKSKQQKLKQKSVIINNKGNKSIQININVLDISSTNTNTNTNNSSNKTNSNNKIVIKEKSIKNNYQNKIKNRKRSKSSNCNNNNSSKISKSIIELNINV